MDKILVYSSPIRALMANAILDPNLIDSFVGFGFLSTLVAEARTRGFAVETLDCFLSHPASRNAFLVSDMGTHFWLQKKIALPTVCFSVESPLVAWDYTLTLRWISKFFNTIIAWPGMISGLSSNCDKYLPLFWPNTCCSISANRPWEHKHLLVMINSNKNPLALYKGGINLMQPIRSTYHLGRYGLGRFVRKCCHWMKSELYVARLHAITFFSGFPDFHLYGYGWDTPIRDCEKNMRSAVTKCWRGAIDQGEENKRDVLRNYKFALCFENTSFPGYVTEKIFDCLFCGCIPIYLGAPDIVDYVPPESFVDMRKFHDYSELRSFLLNMNISEARSYLESAADFVSSSFFAKFQAQYLVNQIMDSVENAASKQ